MESDKSHHSSGSGETIAAISTPPGAGGIGVVRVSGSATGSIALDLLGALPPPRVAKLCRFRDDEQNTIDEGLAIFFKAPNTYTGEDVLELHGHGGAVILDLLLERVLKLGARSARPGEFTERAFLNGKIDLAQAEAVADLIESRTRAAARAAVRSLSGVFSKEIGALEGKLAELRAYVEAEIDFSDEEIDGLTPGAVKTQTAAIRAHLEEIINRARPGAMLAAGASAVLAGAPNAGKSSVMNALSETDRAIVSHQPGTTRDLVETEINIDGLVLRLVDTAGLRNSADSLEAEGVRRAEAAISNADLVLFVVDDTLGPQNPQHDIETSGSLLQVVNKCDVTGRPYGKMSGAGPTSVAISATENEGLESLMSAIKSSLGYEGATDQPLSARSRHLDALRRSKEHLVLAQGHQASAGLELCAEELKLAQGALGEITGPVTTEDLLGQIFATFCIGK